MAAEQPARDSSDAVTVVSESRLSEKDVQETSQQKPKTLLQRIKTGVLAVGIILTMFMVSLNSTVVAPAMSKIATDLDALDKQTWIATVYLVAMNSFQPLSGKFSDIFGRKPVYLFGMFFFFLGSLVNALSPTIEGLIAGRTLQGFGAGGIMSMLFIIITDMAPLHFRPRLQSILVVVYGLASVVGPLIGGAFVDNVTWRWDFWLNIILSGVSIVVIFFLFKETSKVKKESFKAKLLRVDFLGTIFSVSFITCLLLALTWGPLYGWGNGHSYGPFIAAGISLILLIICQGWISREPILPAKVMLNPRIVIIYLYMVCLGLGFIGTLYFGPVLFQSVFGADSTASGVRLIPYMALLIVGSVGSTILIHHIPYVKAFVCFGAACNMIGYGLFYTVDEDANWAQQACYLMFCGLAFGLSQQNCILGVQQVAPPEYIAVATALVNFFMLLATSIGIAVYQTLFSTFLEAQYTHVDPEILGVANEYGALSNYLYIRNMPKDTQGPIIHAYMEALHYVFIMPIVASAISFICAVFIHNKRFGASAPKKDIEITEDKTEVPQADKVEEN